MSTISTSTIFLNLSNHKLTSAQEVAIRNMSAKVVSYKNAFSQELVANLENSPSEYYQLRKVVKELFSQINEFYTDQLEEGSITVDSKFVMLVHLPIGSPAFNFEFARYLGTMNYYEYTHLQFLFSHTERISIEKDGIKNSIFEFSHFIEM